MATITTAQDGLASATTTWTGGVVPGSGDEVLISHEVTLDGSYQWGDDTIDSINIKSGGILKYSRTQSSHLLCRGDLLISDNGELDMGKTGDIIPSGIIADLQLNNSATTAENKYGLHKTNLGKFYTHGAVKNQKAILTAVVPGGTNTITVDNIIDFNIGDEVCIPTTSEYTKTEYAEITAINGNIITLDNFISNWVDSPVSAFRYTHQKDILVFNLTTNVKIRGLDRYRKSFIKCYNNAISIQENQYTEFYHIDNDASTGSNYGFSIQNYKVGAVASFNNNVIKHGDRGLDFYGSSQSMDVEDCIFTNITGQAGIYFRGGALASVYRCYIIDCAYGIQSGYSQGGADIKLFDTTFIGLNRAVYANPIIGLTLTRCIFDFNNVIILQSQASDITFKECLVHQNPNNINTNDALVYVNTRSLTNLKFIDCTMNTSSFVAAVRYQERGLDSNRITFANLDLDPTQQFIYTNAGTMIRDNSIYRASSPSVQIACIDDSKPFEFKMTVFAPTGSPVVVSGYIRKDSNYTEIATLPTVTISGLGITPDSYTIADIDNEWQQFSVQATQNSGTDGMLDLTIVGQSDSGIMWVDDIVGPVAKPVNVGELGYWSGGSPVSSILANFTSANDVWNSQTSGITLPGSIGVLLKKVSGIYKFLKWK